MKKNEKLNETNEKPVVTLVFGQTSDGKNLDIKKFNEYYTKGKAETLTHSQILRIFFELTDFEKEQDPEIEIDFSEILESVIGDKKDIIINSFDTKEILFEIIEGAHKSGYLVIANVLPVSDERKKVEELERCIKQRNSLEYCITTNEEIKDESKEFSEFISDQENFMNNEEEQGLDILNVWFEKEDGSLELEHTEFKISVLSEENRTFLRNAFSEGLIKKYNDTDFKSASEALKVGKDIDKSILKIKEEKRVEKIKEEIDTSNKNEVELLNEVYKETGIFNIDDDNQKRIPRIIELRKEVGMENDKEQIKRYNEFCASYPGFNEFKIENQEEIEEEIEEER